MPTRETPPKINLSPLRRHDSATQLDNNTNTIKSQAPQPILNPFPCSRRRHQPNNKPATCLISPPSSPPPPTPKQNPLQTALLYLARAAAHLPLSSAAAESLYDFAAPNWTLGRWRTEVEEEREKGRRGREGADGRPRDEKASAGDWVRRAVGVLKREGEEGEYWRDGRDLEGLWGRIGGDH